MLTDEALIERVQKGDDGALEQLLERHEKNIYNIALRTVCNHDDAMDLAQDSIIKIVRALRGFKRESTFRVWAYRITVNTCYDELRRRKKRGAISLDAYLEAGGPEPADISELPEVRAESSELKRLLERAIGELPKDYRAALVLRDITGMSYQEISDTLNVSLGTVKSRINRGRNILKSRLSEQFINQN